MVKMYFLCCSYRTRIKDHGIIKLRIAGLDIGLAELVAVKAIRGGKNPCLSEATSNLAEA